MYILSYEPLFYNYCLVYGRDIPTVIEQPFDMQDILTVSPKEIRTVVHEARYLKSLFLKLQTS